MNKVKLREHSLMKTPLITGFVLLAFVFACNKWELERASFLQVLTVGVIDVSATSATLLGDIEDLRNGSIENAGFVLSAVHSEENTLRIGAGQEEEIKLAIAPLQDTVQAFGARADGLTPNTTYFFRSFLKLTELEEPIYGKILSFATTGLDLSILSVRKISGSGCGRVEITAGVAKGQAFDANSETGFVWTTDTDNPGVAIEGTLLAEGQSSRDQFTVETDLECDKTYFVRAFVRTGPGMIVYSAPFAVSTKQGGEWLPRTTPFNLPETQDSYMFSIGSKVFMGGGRNFGFNNFLRIFDFNTNMWEEEVQLEPFGEHKYSVLNAVGLGTNEEGLAIPGFRHDYYPDTIASQVCWGCGWCACAERPDTGFGHSCSEYDPEAYIFELDENGNVQASSYPLSGFDQNRFGAYGVNIEGKLYFGGGVTVYSQNQPAPNPSCAIFHHQDLLEVVPGDPQLNTIDSDLPHPPGRLDGVAININNKGYIGLGLQILDSTWPVYPGTPAIDRLTDFWKFDPTAQEAGQWTELTTFPDENHVPYRFAFSSGNKGYVLTDPPEINIRTGLWQFNPLEGETGDWKEIENVPSVLKSRTPLAATTVGNVGFIYFSGDEETFWIYVSEI